MTEYGRSPGSEPWYPDDPLYGDGAWSEGHGATGEGAGHQGSWDGYAGPQDPSYQQQPPQHQYPGYAQDPSGGQGAWDAAGGHGGYGPEAYGTGSYGADAGYDPRYAEQYPEQYPGTYGAGQDAGYGASYGEQPGEQYGEQQYGGGYPGSYADPYAGQYDGGPSDGYGTAYAEGRTAPPQADGYAGAQVPQQADGYGTGAYPAAPAPQRPEPGPFPRQDRAGDTGGPSPAAEPGTGPGPDPETGWDPGPDQGERDFFAARDDEDEDGSARRGGGGRRSERAPGTGGKKRRAGCGCMVAALLVAGGVGGAGWYGYQFYQERFGPAPDYTGEGTGEVTVEIPEGSTVSDIGNILKEQDVVRSHDAFVEAAGDASLQAGVYTLRRQMSAEAALAMLSDPANAGANALIIPEGHRATEIFGMIDERLGLAEGTTEEAAQNTDLGLPEWAGGNVEGFLYPTRYDVGEDTTPEELLTEMVDRAEAEFADLGLEDRAAGLDRTPYEILTIASLIEAEGQSDDEFGKVSRVIYNRLEQNMQLGFDSTLNYALGRDTLDVTIEDTQIDSPYNTYEEFGLPPTPIDNPGERAIEAALNPTEGDWLYFVTVREGDTRFTADYDEHMANVEEFNEVREQEGGE